MKKRWALLLILLLINLIASGCSGDSDSKEAKKSLVGSVDQNPLYLGGDEEAPLREIDQMVETRDDIFDSAVIQKDKDILVVYKVKHLKRFRMKQIEKSIKGDLEKKYKSYSFVVSSDMKIFLEAVELIVHVKQENYPKDKAKKWFDDILKLQKEMT